MSFTRGFKQAGGFPKNGEMVDVPSRHSRDGWAEVATHTSVVLHGKQYRNMKEWSRPCVICNEKFSAFESSSRSDANSQFSNKTCTPHRGLLPALEKGFIAWSKELGGMVPGAMCVSRDVPAGAPSEELEGLRSWKATVSEELAGLDQLRRDYGKVMAEVQPLKAEIHALKTELAPYKLKPALEAAKPFDGHAALAAELAAKNKMPWE